MAVEGKTDTQQASWAGFGSSFCRFWQSAPTPLLRWQQPPSDHVQIRQCEHGEQPRSVLRKAPVTHLGEAPQALHDVKGVLTFRPSCRAQAIDAPTAFDIGARVSVFTVSANERLRNGVRDASLNVSSESPSSTRTTLRKGVKATTLCRGGSLKSWGFVQFHPHQSGGGLPIVRPPLCLLPTEDEV